MRGTIIFGETDKLTQYFVLTCFINQFFNQQKHLLLMTQKRFRMSQRYDSLTLLFYETCDYWWILRLKLTKGGKDRLTKQKDQ